MKYKGNKWLVDIIGNKHSKTVKEALTTDECYHKKQYEILKHSESKAEKTHSKLVHW